MSPDRTPLQPFLAPAGIAIFGASAEPGTPGFGLLQNLKGGPFAERIHLVSARHEEIAGHPCHASLTDIRAPLTLAVIASPTNAVCSHIEACAQRGIRAAVVLSGGLRPATAVGAQLVETAARLRVRLFGPDALGYVLPHAGLNLTPITQSVPAGNLALVSQSAAICASILDWNHNEEFGFSAIFAPGESEDIELPEVLDYLAGDPKTESILLYLEGLRDARGFMSAVRAAASIKPVIAVKAGRNPVSARIAEAHSGGRSDRDDAFDAALRRAGVLRVHAIGDMFTAARALTAPRKPRGNRLAIVSNGGGPAVMALDQAGEFDIALASLSPHTAERLNALRPSTWSDGNPVDIGFDARPEHFVDAISACADDPDVDGILAILTPNTFVDPMAVAQATIEAAAKTDKPILTSWLGELHTRAARSAFVRARFPTFRTPENAVTAFSFMVNWVHNQALRLETPAALSSYTPPDAAAARGIIEHALAEGRSTLTLPEAKAVLTAFHVPVTPTLQAATPTEAVSVANHLGYPLAMKALPASSGVRLQLRSAPEVALAFRELAAAGAGAVLLEPQVYKPEGRWLAAGLRLDRLFGPVISISESGIAPIIYNARSVGLPPLNSRLVDTMLRVPHVARLLGPLPGKPAVAEGPLREILLRISEMASELPWLTRLDITSLIADQHGAIAVDAQIEIQPLAIERERYGHMAICPYPAQLESAETLKDGSACTLRPIRPEDTAALQDFVRRLSMRSKRLRFFSALSELPPHQLARYAQIDYGRDMVIIATREEGGNQVILGEARYSILLDGRTCDFAVVIADDMAGKGLGVRLMNRLMDASREQGLVTIRGQVLADNEPMLGLMEVLDFSIKLTDDESMVEVSRPL